MKRVNFSSNKKFRDLITSSHNTKVFFFFNFKETFDCTDFSKAQYDFAVAAYRHGFTGMTKLTAHLCNFAF